MTKEKKNPICAVWWHDASYCFQKELPEEIPGPRLTVGFIIESNDKFINITTDVGYNKEKQSITPRRGHLIPKGAIINFEVIDFLSNHE